MAVADSQRRGPRVRFAPSPTGDLHVGNARTALVNWLVARGNDGWLVLRIEDTDVKRSSRAAEQRILEDLHWLGLDWDEGPRRAGDVGPYRQSERMELYGQAAQALRAAGALYPCFCAPDELAALRAEAREQGATFRYPGTCRELSPGEAERRSRQQPPALRFRVPRREVRFVDGLRGETGLASGELGDFVVVRADGRPTYNLVCVVDDYAMRIDHVIRGEDHLPNTPRQLLIYEALGFSPPLFTHLPLVLGPDRTRLSKRHGATSVAELRAGGILPAALRNLLALLGWGPADNNEVMGSAEMVEEFDLDKLSPTSAVFDVAKLEWLNGQHLADLSIGELMAAATPFLEAAGHVLPERGPALDWWGKLLDLVRIGRRRLDELPDAAAPVLSPRLELVRTEPSLREVLAGERAEAVLRAFASASNAGELRSPDSFRAAAGRILEATETKGRQAFHPLRVAISAMDSGPELALLAPIIEEGASLPLRPAIPNVAGRITEVLRARPDADE